MKKIETPKDSIFYPDMSRYWMLWIIIEILPFATATQYIESKFLLLSIGAIGIYVVDKWLLWIDKNIYRKSMYVWKNGLRKAKANIIRRHKIKEEVLKYYKTAYAVGILPKYKEFEIDISDCAYISGREVKNRDRFL